MGEVKLTNFYFLCHLASESKGKTFLNENHDFIKNGCNFKRIATDLHNAGVVDDGDLETLLQSPNYLDANQFMYLCLVRDPSIEKLSKLAEVLERDSTHGCHKSLACSIRKFIS